ncbi:DNA cytosine methyltransferase [Mesorhizobium sp. M0088]|uniref:DNA cytosine methyltransferase n=1 Tax=Mesorhizobium sp. M0088 TaxID=2956873 RepID=UPI00333D3E84
MRYGSVASGIEAASTAWSPLGWQAAFLAEIEPFPCHVLHEHYSSGRPQFMPDPDQPGLKPKDRKARIAAMKAIMGLPERANGVPNHGDMTQFEEWPDHAIDLLVGGTPCQTYSVAGLRKGLDDPRGDLMLTYVAIARRYRPRWLVWENVFGVLSSKGGRDFASLLGLLSGRRVEVPAGGWKSSGIVEGYSGAYGLSWRVLDTQYVRVDGAPRALPQRRRRVFVVGHTGGDWRRAAAVLLEREGLSGNPAPRREQGKGVAPTIAARPTGGGGLGTDFDLDGGQPTVSAVAGCMIRQDHGGVDSQTALNGYQIPVAEAFGGNNCSGPIEAAARLAAHGGPAGRMDFASETFVVANPLRAQSQHSHRLDSDNVIVAPVAHEVAETLTSNGDAHSGFREAAGLVAHSLRAEGFDASEDGTGRGTPLVPIAFDTTQITSKANRSNPKQGDPCHPLAAGAHPPAIAFTPQNDGGDATEELSPTLRVGTGLPERGEGMAVCHSLPMQMQWAVRRLTPAECARLQGFPDDHCRIPWRGKPAEQCPDGPQYKAYGNSMSTNVMRWLGERIEMVEQIAADLEKEAAA